MLRPADSKNLCPESAPCCSQYGYCGSGPEFCLGGCNPFASTTVSSCAPNAICKTQDYTFTDGSRILTDITKFDGSPDTYDWIVEGGDFEVADENLALILTETNSGTRLSSTRFIQYGTITATLKTGQWNGVVLGFITMSKDEIDWEFPGSKTTEAQTNFFWQGINTHGDTSGGLTNTHDNYHDYTINWTPEALIFQIDGKTVRTLKASQFPGQYPSTPSRIQLSLWPAGTSPYPGTVEWSGGPIDWKNPDYIAAGNKFKALL
ncbi:concanavalin A-like lectin/glucanase domain-containing protein [Mycena floridula]|nr:concanavalin A-like lectin/glucanase domain-containing protein [Mycena floridula]